MPDLTPAEALGTGPGFSQHWDVETRAGSVALRSGIDKLGEDLAFQIIRTAREQEFRGRRYTPELREDVRIVVQRVATSDSRVQRVEDITIQQSDDASQTAEVQLTVIAETGARGEFVFSV